jgi:hypothetical protein
LAVKAITRGDNRNTFAQWAERDGKERADPSCSGENEAMHGRSPCAGKSVDRNSSGGSLIPLDPNCEFHGQLVKPGGQKPQKIESSSPQTRSSPPHLGITSSPMVNIRTRNHREPSVAGVDISTGSKSAWSRKGFDKSEGLPYPVGEARKAFEKAGLELPFDRARLPPSGTLKRKDDLG